MLSSNQNARFLKQLFLCNVWMHLPDLFHSDSVLWKKQVDSITSDQVNSEISVTRSTGQSDCIIPKMAISQDWMNEFTWFFAWRFSFIKDENWYFLVYFFSNCIVILFVSISFWSRSSQSCLRIHSAYYTRNEQTKSNKIQ